jgi:hypothetical protein
MRVRQNVRLLAGHPAFESRLSITWTYGDSDTGLPDEDESEQMTMFEDRLLDTYEQGNHAIAVAVITHNSRREWVFYSSDLRESQRRINQEFAGEGPFPVKLEATDDPRWQQYIEILQTCGAEH